jgi:hypothetical protein
MKKPCYELVVIDDLESADKTAPPQMTAKLLGPCKSFNHAETMLNSAYAEKKLNKPAQVMLVARANIRPCRSTLRFEIQPVVENPASSPPDAGQPQT